MSVHGNYSEALLKGGTTEEIEAVIEAFKEDLRKIYLEDNLPDNKAEVVFRFATSLSRGGLRSVEELYSKFAPLAIALENEPPF